MGGLGPENYVSDQVERYPKNSYPDIQPSNLSSPRYFVNYHCTGDTATMIPVLLAAGGRLSPLNLSVSDKVDVYYMNESISRVVRNFLFTPFLSQLLPHPLVFQVSSSPHFQFPLSVPRERISTITSQATTVLAGGLAGLTPTTAVEYFIFNGSLGYHTLTTDPRGLTQVRDLPLYRHHFLPLHQARYGSCMAAHWSGVVFVIGGTTSVSPVNPVTTVDVFITGSINVPSITFNLQTPRRYCAAAFLGPFLYVAGGETSPGLYTNTVEVVDLRGFFASSGLDRPAPPLSNFSYAEALELGVQGMAGIQTNDAIYFLGGGQEQGAYSTPLIYMYRCGNGVGHPSLIILHRYSVLSSIHLPSLHLSLLH